MLRFFKKDMEQKDKLDFITTCETEIEKLIQQNLSQDEQFQKDLQKVILDLTYEIQDKILDENTHTYEFIHYQTLLLDMNNLFENLKKRGKKQESKLEAINHFLFLHTKTADIYKQLAKPFVLSCLICTSLAALIILAYTASIDFKRGEIGLIPFIFVLAIPDVFGIILIGLIIHGIKLEIPTYKKIIGRSMHETTCRPKIETICNILLKQNPS